MNYDTLSLVELKQLAKGRRIKMYYTKSIRELRWLLAQPELPEKYKLEKLTIKELREEAKEKGVRGFWSLSRGDLMKLLHPDTVNRPAPQKDNQNQKDAQKHDSPDTDNSNEIGIKSL